MINFKELFLWTLIVEIGNAYTHGVLIKTPVTAALPPKKLDTTLEIDDLIIEFYNQTSRLELAWELTDTPENIEPFQKNEFIIENYLKKDYSWSFVKELISGYINITASDLIFDKEYNDQQTFAYTLKKLKTTDTFFAFDIQSSVTACFKKTNNQVSDTIWLIHTDADKVYDMKIGLEEYLNLAYQAKCFKNWQLVYLFREKASEYELMKQFIPFIFNHIKTDLSAFDIPHI
ncbi:hypothetical protein [Flavobacterium collinsii]|uniref:Uncharacterized protein n=1 Tax=Flavobacterium collinsii TaxID=1114861 RepID=A0A9W4THL3_9FLAO|nr:hypothetical protein [Flavobacterium collinsii]CAI2766902.1 conserved protein of unknown function [Flavobacterium collinsii]